MSFNDFWISVRSAAGTLAPEVIVDSPRLNPTEIERALRGATLWLSRSAVAGFREEDIDFLTAAERTRLASSVAEFRAVADTVSPTAPAPAEAVDRALPLFLEIVEALDFSRYADPEAFRIGKQIEREIGLDHPGLAELRFRTGLDHTGDPGLWIWAFLADGPEETDEWFLATARRWRESLEPIARRVCPDRFPYLAFRSLAEESEPVEAS